MLLALFWVLSGMLLMCRAQEKPSSATDEPPKLPKGVEILARGPVHEAFASPGGEPLPTQAVPKRPPKPLDEIPPADKPEGKVVWIGGYWSWDDERKDFLWVSGLWRTPPPHKQWIPGYWREQGDQWQWVAGFWTDVVGEDKNTKEVAYLPKPPAMPNVAPVGAAPVDDCFYVPGVWTWNPVAQSYAWRAGYWARIQPGYVWVADHYLWTPNGYVFVPGYWDLAVNRRGFLYAPVYVQPEVVTVGFTYTPYYVVGDAFLVETLFVRPAFCHYYFGDYYGPAYARLGYESIFVYSGRRYDSIVVYETWAHRAQPNWVSAQINIVSLRSRGVMPLPPRTLVQQNTLVGKGAPILTPASQLMAAKGLRTAPMDASTRALAQQQAASIQHAATQRIAAEHPSTTGTPSRARVASLNVTKTHGEPAGFASQRGSAFGSGTTPHGAYPSFVPGGYHPASPYARPGQPQRGMPGSRPTPHTSEPPSRRPPPRDTRQHHG
jgi:hypothetical protein